MKAWQVVVGLLLVLVVSTVGLKARAEDDVDDLHLWVPVTLELPINDKVSTSLQVEGRWDNRIQDANGLRVISGVEYAINDQVAVNATYGWYPNFDEGEIDNEHRLQQEVEFSKKWRKVAVALAQRLEERFLEDVEGTAFRTRTLLTIRVPIKNTRLYLVCRDDLRFNLNSPENGPRAGFNQNRIFVGLGRTIGKATIEGGYQLRYENVRDSEADNRHHTVLVRLNYRLR